MIEDILNSYYNGNFEQMRDEIKESSLSISEMIDILPVYANDTDIMSILKIFLIKEGY